MIAGEEFPTAFEISMSTFKRYIEVAKSGYVDGFTKYIKIVASLHTGVIWELDQRSIEQVLDTAIFDYI